MSKESVNYRTSRPGDKHCGNCAMFRASSNSCNLVAGRIDSGSVCDRWVPTRPVKSAATWPPG